MRVGTECRMGERDYARGNFAVLFLPRIKFLTSIQLLLPEYFPQQLQWKNLDLFHHYYEEPFVYCLLYQIIKRYKAQPLNLRICWLLEIERFL